MSVLVTGGAGYIGSVTVDLLRERGYEVVVLDDLVRGHREAVDPGVPLYEGHTGDRPLVERICREHRVDSCRIFATGLGEIRAAAAAAADHRRQLLHQLSRLETRGYISGDAGHHGHLAFGGRSGEEHHPRRQRRLHLIGDRAQQVLARVVDPAGDERHVADRYPLALGARLSGRGLGQLPM